MGLKDKLWGRGASPLPKDGGRVIPDSVVDALLGIPARKPVQTDYRYLYSTNQLRQLAAEDMACRVHVVRSQNEQYIQCSCGLFFSRMDYPGHIAEHV